METSFERVAVVGSGAIGLFFGTRLGVGGADVRFLMRGDLTAVRARGSVIVRGVRETWELKPVSAFGSPAEIGPVDLVIVALKTTSAGDVDGLVRPLLGTDTAILTLQNGLGPDEFLGSLFGPERILGGLVFMALNRSGPGEVTCFNTGTVSVGEFGRPAGERVSRLAAQLGQRAGIGVQVVQSLLEARWSKLVWNVPFNGLSVAEGGITTDRICADPRLAAEARALMREIQQAAHAQGIAIPDGFLVQQFEKTPPMGAYRPSSLVDFLAGREVEIEAIWGEPLRRAQAAGIETPRLAELYARLCTAKWDGTAPLIP